HYMTSARFAGHLTTGRVGSALCSKNTTAGANSRTARSATRTAAFLGPLSPKVTCKKVTTINARINAMLLANSGSIFNAVRGTEKIYAIAGSETCRIKREQTVIPNWQMARMAVT